MHDHTPEAAQAIESHSRQFTHKLWVDWDNDGGFGHELSDLSPYAIRTSRNQALSSTAPAELMLIDGYGAASFEVGIAGLYKGIPLTGQFSPYNGHSVFYPDGIPLGVEMYYEISVWTDHGWESYRQVTGIVRDVESSRGGGVVQLDCLDYVEKVRNEVDLPAYASPLEDLQEGRKRATLVDSSSIIDLAARSGGFLSGPRPGGRYESDSRIASVFRVPLHGSILPEIGTVADGCTFHDTEAWSGDRAEAYREGPFGYLALNAVPMGEESSAVKKFHCDVNATSDQIQGYGSWGLSAWILWEGTGTANDSTVIQVERVQHRYQLVVESSNGQVNARWQGASGSYYISPDTWLPLEIGWNFVEARFEVDTASGGYVRGQTRVGTTETALATLYTGDMTQTPGDKELEVTVQNVYAVSDAEILYSDEITYAQYVQHWPPDDQLETANVSWGRNRFTHVHRDKGTSAWGLIKDVASAEYGAVYFDEFGVLQFLNFEDVTALQKTPVRTFTLDQVDGLSLRTTMDSVRNQWVVTTQSGYSDDAIIYDLSRDGVPLTAGYDYTGSQKQVAWLSEDPDDAIFSPARFTVPYDMYEHFWIPVGPEVVSFIGSSVTTTSDSNSAWTREIPIHNKKVYTGDDFIDPDTMGTVPTLQNWESREYIHLGVFNNSSLGLTVGFWLNSKNEGRFRMGGRSILEQPKDTWKFSSSDVGNTESIDKYGVRSIELAGNYWLQDKFQTREMLRAVIEKFSSPIPVTDKIKVPGDPRIQIGDVIEVQDPRGMGESIKLQIYGIDRGLENGSGLTDVYQVEVVEAPGKGVWDSSSYGIWEQSFIWGD